MELRKGTWSEHLVVAPSPRNIEPGDTETGGNGSGVQTRFPQRMLWGLWPRICAQMSCRLGATVLSLSIRIQAYDDLFFIFDRSRSPCIVRSISGVARTCRAWHAAQNVRGQSAGIKSIKASATDQWCCKIFI